MDLDDLIDDIIGDGPSKPSAAAAAIVSNMQQAPPQIRYTDVQQHSN